MNYTDISNRTYRIRKYNSSNTVFNNPKVRLFWRFHHYDGGFPVYYNRWDVIRERLFWMFSAKNNNLKYFLKKDIDYSAPNWIKYLRSGITGKEWFEYIKHKVIWELCVWRIVDIRNGGKVYFIRRRT